MSSLQYKDRLELKAMSTGMLLPKITIYQLQDFHLSSRYQNENANRIIFIQHIVTHDACMRS